MIKKIIIGYIILSYLATPTLLFFWLREMKAKFKKHSQFERHIESKKIMWIVTITISPLIIPILIFQYIYKGIIKIGIYIKYKNGNI